MSDSEANGNIVGEHRGPNVTSGSVEDLSEYTDADESISAPTEILAEFLSAIMLKDYETALKYCKLILHYEPNNSTAREFYPLIAEKIELMKAEQDGTDDESSSDFSDSAPSTGSNNSESESKATDSDATSASYSSLEDEEADRENNVREPVNTSLKSNDIANGNAARPKDSTDPAAGVFTSNMPSKTDNPKVNEELKRKLEKVINRNSISLTENINRSPISSKKTYNNNNLTLTPNLKRSTRFHNDPVFEDATNRTRSGFYSFAVKSCSNSPKHEVDNANYPLFSSDSESPTDPTVQETKAKDVKTFRG